MKSAATSASWATTTTGPPRKWPPAPPTMASLIDVDILGHIFEQSITDLEKLRNELEGGAAPAGLASTRAAARRKGRSTPPRSSPATSSNRRWGVFSRIVSSSCGRPTRKPPRDRPGRPGRPQDLRTGRAEEAGTGSRWCASGKRGKTSWRGPAAGPRLRQRGFLIRSLRPVARGLPGVERPAAGVARHRTLFDLDKRILENNLYGVDLNEEAIEICRLSLWIKTAARQAADEPGPYHPRGQQHRRGPRRFIPRRSTGRPLSPRCSRRADLTWSLPTRLMSGRNCSAPSSRYLERPIETYHGMADLYVYFYELGMRLLKPGGRLSFVVTNKWMKAGYGEPLRRFFREEAWVESVVDFGHAKQIFEDADVFPSIIVARRPTGEPPPATARLCTIPRDQLRIDDLSAQIEREGATISLAQLRDDGWQIGTRGRYQVDRKNPIIGKPLLEFAGVRPCRGILTGFNEAFLIDTAMKEKLVKADAKCAEIIKPYVRGQDVERWYCGGAGLWMIVMKSSGDHAWPWSASGKEAEKCFSKPTRAFTTT